MSGGWARAVLRPWDVSLEKWGHIHGEAREQRDPRTRALG